MGPFRVRVIASSLYIEISKKRYRFSEKSKCLHKKIIFKTSYVNSFPLSCLIIFVIHDYCLFLLEDIPTMHTCLKCLYIHWEYYIVKHAGTVWKILVMIFIFYISALIKTMDIWYGIGHIVGKGECFQNVFWFRGITIHLYFLGL